MIKPVYTFAAVFCCILLIIGIAVSREEGVPGTSAELNYSYITGTTARLSGENHIMDAISYSRAAYPDNRPGAVVLVRDDDLFAAAAATRLLQVNAPMLFVTGNGTRIPNETKEEMRRLRPEGVRMDNNIQVYVAGDINRSVMDEVSSMGLEARNIYSDNPFGFTEVLDEFMAILHGGYKEIVFIASAEHPEFSYPIANWNALSGDALLYVTNNIIPEETLRTLRKRSPGNTYVYILAPPEIISEETVSVLSMYGYVQRIPGNTAQEMSVRFAGYSDTGRLSDWWLGYRTRNVGWGISEPGHNMILAAPNDWRVILPSGILSRTGKHGFLLLTDENGNLPPPARTFLEIIKPTRAHPSQQAFNFAWILRGVKNETEKEAGSLLSVD